MTAYLIINATKQPIQRLAPDAKNNCETSFIEGPFVSREKPLRSMAWNLFTEKTAAITRRGPVCHGRMFRKIRRKAHA